MNMARQQISDLAKGRFHPLPGQRAQIVHIQRVRPFAVGLPRHVQPQLLRFRQRVFPTVVGIGGIRIHSCGDRQIKVQRLADAPVTVRRRSQDDLDRYARRRDHDMRPQVYM